MKHIIKFFEENENAKFEHITTEEFNNYKEAQLRFNEAIKHTTSPANATKICWDEKQTTGAIIRGIFLINPKN